ncbi:MAG: AMP-binding protein [Muribaculaceae bacterium]|nr:AMP-binding protein [Muribaculaceae bacterium]
MDLLKILSDSFQDNWDECALSQYETGMTLCYSGLACRIGRLHMLLRQLKIERGCHIGIVGRNSIDWITNYMGSMIYGALTITLPVTHSNDEIAEMLQQVDTEVLFIDEDIFMGGIELSEMPSLRLVISNDTSKILYCRDDMKREYQRMLDMLDFQFQSTFPNGFVPGISNIETIRPDAHVAIFFTSGTTGKPRPVVLSADNIEGNLIYGIKAGIAPRKSTLVTSTKVGTVWGTIFNILVPIVSGAHLEVYRDINDVEKMITVFKKVKPVRMMLSSLTVGKLYRCAVRQHNERKMVRMLNKFPGGRFITGLILKNSVRKMLGSHCEEVMVGYLMMNSNMAYKLRKVGLPITVVYGLTECGGLVGYTPAANYRSGTSGSTILSLVKTRVRPFTLPGLPDNAGVLEIKGMTVMKQYYKDESATKKAFTTDGWLSTGDIATINSHGDLTILGRVDTIIKLSRGTVLPEKVQILMYEHPFIKDVIVAGQDDKLVALIYPNIDEIDRHYGQHSFDIRHIINNVVTEINAIMPLICHIDEVIVSDEPLNLTAKGTVARELYT